MYHYVLRNNGKYAGTRFFDTLDDMKSDIENYFPHGPAFVKEHNGRVTAGNAIYTIEFQIVPTDFTLNDTQGNIYNINPKNNDG